MLFLFYIYFPDRSSTAAALASHYGGACLSVDAVVTDLLLNGTSPVALSARELCECAAAEQFAGRKAVETGESCCSLESYLRLAPKRSISKRFHVKKSNSPNEHFYSRVCVIV